MDFASLVPVWLDAFLIAPFRWPGSAEAGLWLGSAILSCYCLVLGELSAILVYLWHRERLEAMQAEVMRCHNLSVDAIHAGDKDAYLAINKMAHEEFGKSFFAQAGIGMASIWPVPFALGWLALRFEGIPVYDIPGTSLHAGYVFVFLTCYIALRVLLARNRRRLPFLVRIEALKDKARAARGQAKHF